MKKMIAEVYKRPSNSLGIGFYCLEDDGTPVYAITETLLDLIEQSTPRHDRELEELVLQAEAGKYISPNLALPDFGANETNIWLTPPMAKPGCVCISNEDTVYARYDEEEDEPPQKGEGPQQFTYEQFKAALAYWRQFRQKVDREGRENLVGKRFEAVFPEAAR